MSRFRNAAIGFATLLLVLAGSCSKKTTAPPPPEVRLGPEVEAVFPPARSTRVLTTTDIWVKFHNNVEPATLNERTVFLKVDTRRLSIALSYDAPTRTLRITPRVALGLYQTHTIELMPAVQTADGVPLGQTRFWQFTTSSVRPPANPLPVLGAEMESPNVMMFWRPTEPSAGAIEYRIFVSADSDSVISRSVAPIIVPVRNYHVPTRPWPMGSTVYWSVTVRNVDVGEEYEGPLWHYATLPEGTPIDSMSFMAAQWGTYDRRFGGRRSCNQSMGVGDDYTTAARWNLDGLPSDVRVAAAVLQMPTSSTVAGRNPTIWGITEPFLDCLAMSTPGPPWPNDALGVLASGRVLPQVPGRVRFEGPLFSAFVEGMARHRGLHGFLFKASQFMVYSYLSPGRDLTVYYYLVPPVAPRP